MGARVRRAAALDGEGGDGSMAENTITEKTRFGLPAFVALSIIVSAITGTAAAVASAYSFKEGVMERLEQHIQANGVMLTRQQDQALQHYLSLERFGEWRQSERIRQDQQYYSLLNAVDRLRLALETRHR